MGSPYITYIILGIAVLLFLVTLIKDWLPFSKKEKEETPEKEHPIFTHSKNGQEIILPLCLQAYERLIVFLERIKLEKLIKRLHRPDLTVKETEQLFIESIRSEFEHNVSQQIYVSPASWEAVSTATEQLIRYIHIAASKLPAADNGHLLSKKLLSQPFNDGESPVQIATEILNTESKKLMNSNKGR